MTAKTASEVLAMMRACMADAEADVINGTLDADNYGGDVANAVARVAWVSLKTRLSCEASGDDAADLRPTASRARVEAELKHRRAS